MAPWLDGRLHCSIQSHSLRLLYHVLWLAENCNRSRSHHVELRLQTLVFPEPCQAASGIATRQHLTSWSENLCLSASSWVSPLHVSGLLALLPAWCFHLWLLRNQFSVARAPGEGTSLSSPSPTNIQNQRNGNLECAMKKILQPKNTPIKTDFEPKCSYIRHINIYLWCTIIVPFACILRILSSVFTWISESIDSMVFVAWSISSVYALLILTRSCSSSSTVPSSSSSLCCKIPVSLLKNYLNH